MKKIILSITGSLLCLNAFANTPATTATAPSNSPAPSVKSGTSTNWVEGARIEIIEIQDLKTLDVAPAIAEYYDTAGAPWDAISIKKQNDASWYKKIPGLRISGYLNIEEQGVHTMVVDIQTNKIRGQFDTSAELSCSVKGSIENNEVININHKEMNDKSLSSNSKEFRTTPGEIFNAQNAIRLELEPGKYKFTTVIGCIPSYGNNKAYNSPWKPKEFSLGLRLKAPSSKKAILITPSMILHKEK